jgi:hypothetical protein
MDEADMSPSWGAKIAAFGATSARKGKLQWLSQNVLGVEWEGFPEVARFASLAFCFC